MPARRPRAPKFVLAVVVAGLAAPALLLLLFVVAVLGLPPQDAGATGELRYGASEFALGDIPPDYLRLYQEAAAEYGLDWAILAAIGSIESDHGRSGAPGVRSGVNAHGCCGGPMQFWIAPPHPNTWDRHGVDGNGDGAKDPHDPADAIPAAANYLRASGAPGNWRGAIFAYNHATWYVDQVLDRARRYRGDPLSEPNPALATSGRLAWPVRGRVVSPFGQRWGRLHAGIDIAVSGGTPVHTSASGTVTLAAPTSGYGNYVCLRHGQRLTTCYAHLAEIRVRSGERLASGEVLGLSGCTGRCFGDHLHFEVRSGPSSRSTPVDPQLLMRR